MTTEAITISQSIQIGCAAQLSNAIWDEIENCEYEVAAVLIWEVLRGPLGKPANWAGHRHDVYVAQYQEGDIPVTVVTLMYGDGAERDAMGILCKDVFTWLSESACYYDGEYSLEVHCAFITHEEAYPEVIPGHESQG